MTIPFVPSEHIKDAFNCVFCGAFSRQLWALGGRFMPSGWNNMDRELQVCECLHCGERSFWLKGIMIFPAGGSAPPPNGDLPDTIKDDYEEARGILSRSPRGAAALLRLAIQKLCKELNEPGDNLNADIGSLVGKGLPVRVQQALDALRVIGNEAVHPGQMDLTDDVGTATALFGIVNFIAEKMISEPKAVDALYRKLPPEKLAQIAKRDGSAANA